VVAIDRENGRELEITARVTVNATGAGINRLLIAHRMSMGFPLLKAMNLVTRIEAGDIAVGSRSRRGGHLFLVPWRNRAVFGTWQSEKAVPPQEAAPTEDEVSAFVREVQMAFPGLRVSREDVTLVHHGLVPGAAGSSGKLNLEGREQVRDHAGDGGKGLLSVAGTKYTTARATAERVTDRVLRQLARPLVPCKTASTPLPVRVDATSLNPAGIIHAVRHEMARTLEDVVVRRTSLGSLGFPGDAAADRVAAVMATELGWSGDRVDREVTSLRRFYGVG
jgi:glycerol-3-phosphate dehydrogenase